MSNYDFYSKLYSLILLKRLLDSAIHDHHVLVAFLNLLIRFLDDAQPEHSQPNVAFLNFLKRFLDI